MRVDPEGPEGVVEIEDEESREGQVVCEGGGYGGRRNKGRHALREGVSGHAEGLREHKQEKEVEAMSDEAIERIQHKQGERG